MMSPIREYIGWPKLFFYFIMLVGCHWSAMAQTTIKIKGKVTDNSGLPLAGATIQCIRARDSSFSQTREDGTFTVQGLPGQSFTIRVTMNGFTPYAHIYPLAPDLKTIAVPDIILSDNYQSLATATVIAPPPIVRTGDTISYRASAYSVRLGGKLEDLVKKLPGLEINPDSGLLAMGKRVKKMLLDGKPFYGEDIPTALQNIPYDIISKVEIIDDYGDLGVLTGTGTGQPEKVLNITLRPDRNRGEYGNAHVGGGATDQYVSGVSANFLQGARKIFFSGEAKNNNPMGNDYARGAVLTYTDGWSPSWSLSSLAGALKDIRQTSSTLDQYSSYPGGSTQMQQSSQNDVSMNGNRAQLDLLRSTPAGDRLHISGSVNETSQREQDIMNANSNTIDSGSNKTTASLTHDNLADNNITGNWSVYFGQGFRRGRQKLAIGSEVNWISDQQNDVYWVNSEVQADSGQQLTEIQDQRKIIASHQWQVSPNLHYYWQIGTNGLLETNYGLQFNRLESSQNWQTAGSNPQQPWTKVDSLSDDYIYRTTAHSFYSGYTFHQAKTALEIGASVQSSALSGTLITQDSSFAAHYLNILPVLNFVYRFNPSSTLRVNYKSTIGFPTIQQIQPVTDWSNPQNPVTGNPGLRPSTTRTVLISYEHNRFTDGKYSGWNVSLNYSSTAHLVVPDQVHPTDTTAVIQHTYYTNVNGNSNLRLIWRWEPGALFRGRLKWNIGGTIWGARTVALSDYSAYASQSISFDERLSLHYTYKNAQDISANIEYAYMYTVNDNMPSDVVNSAYLSWRLESNHYIFSCWKLNYSLYQTFTSGANSALTPAHILMGAGLQWYFLKKNQLSASLIISNILDAKGSANQVETPTLITQQRTSYLGRTYLLRLDWDFERFHRARK